MGAIENVAVFYAHILRVRARLHSDWPLRLWTNSPHFAASIFSIPNYSSNRYIVIINCHKR